MRVVSERRHASVREAARVARVQRLVALVQMFLEGLRRAGPDLTSAKVIETFETMPEFKSPLIPYPMKFSATNHRGIHGGYLDGFKNGKHHFFGDEIK